MTTQEYVDYVSQFNRISKEDLIKLLLNVIKAKMREQKKQQKVLFLVVHDTLSKHPKKKKRQ